MGTEDADGSEWGSNPAEQLSAVAVATDLLNRVNTLLFELEAFSTLVETQRRSQVLGHRTFIQDVNAEKRFIERLLEKAIADTTPATSGGAANEDEANAPEDPLSAIEADRKIRHQLSSTNVTSYEAQWAAVKTCRGVVSLRQTFSRQPPSRRPQKGGSRALSPSSKIKAHVKKTKNGVYVDAVVDNGAEWLKVSTVSERQLLFQMARQGWQNDSDSDEGFDGGLGKSTGGASGAGVASFEDDSDSDDEDEVVIVRLAKHLTQAAQASRHAYRHPRIRLILPKLEEGRVKEIDSLLRRIRSMSTPAVPFTLETSLPVANAIPPDHGTKEATSPDFTPLLTDPFCHFTPILNIDCTLLVAIASDISHSHCQIQPHYPTAVKGQIRDEEREALLPHTLYPALGSRKLVCTAEAAQRMREIVATIGTDSEVARCNLLLGEPATSSPENTTNRDGAAQPADTPPPLTREALLSAFQSHSIYPVPADLQLPITILPSAAAAAQVVSGDPSAAASPASPQLPKVAEHVGPQLTPINSSIFLHGWATGCTTLSSNGTVAKQIETLVEQHRTCDEEVGPHVWVCPVARSLVAKTGGRVK
ncbi:hypothetical protein MPH_05438 [Macrophomina phaseolina MS6]|uniref:DUF1308 domain-containing protein n=1 Tax=Macrophomina phaseolina (strain MS6) TaxID=1126212 RepID=K2SKQ0_MACPH|nr:hypothetical protein MPH_05438 [Macrophomina phaseolina MS6]